LTVRKERVPLTDVEQILLQASEDSYIKKDEATLNKVKYISEINEAYREWIERISACRRAN
jgi:hypothetical protein